MKPVVRNADHDVDSMTGGNQVTDYVWKDGHWLRDQALIYHISGDDARIPEMVAVLKSRFFEKWSFPNYQEYKHLAIPLSFDHMVRLLDAVDLSLQSRVRTIAEKG